MPAGIVALLALVIAIPSVILVGLIFLPGEGSPTPVRDRPFADLIAAEGRLRTESWQLEPDHRAPFAPLSPEQAHKYMQLHRGCTTEGCARKAAAFYTLVAAGRAKPDSSRAGAR